MKSRGTLIIAVKRTSPSVWRVWIEISCKSDCSPCVLRHPPCGGCGLKFRLLRLLLLVPSSPSVWRVWIEIPSDRTPLKSSPSPSVWRVWIEMLILCIPESNGLSHPPCGGCGLKSVVPISPAALCLGHPPCGGCGLKLCRSARDIAFSRGHPPCGGCGLKFW